MYSKESVWKELQAYLPPDNRIQSDCCPAERLVHILNYKIHLDEYIPGSESDVCVILLHGVGGNGRLLSSLAIPLFKRGYEVICPDLPGYGLSEYQEYPSYNDWINIGSELVRTKLAENKKVVLFGLSAGGMLAYNVACKNEQVSGLIVTNILDNRLAEVREHSAKSKFQAKLGLKLLNLLPDFVTKIKVPIALVTNMKGLVNDADLLRVLLKDKRGAGNKVSLRFLLSMMQSEPIKEPEAFTKVPVLLCHPGNDKWTPTYISELFFDRINAPKQKVILENCGHFPIESPGRETMEDEISKFVDLHSFS